MSMTSKMSLLFRIAFQISKGTWNPQYNIKQEILLLLHTRGRRRSLRKHRSPWLIVHPLILIQHSLDIPAFLIKRHSTLTVAVLITFGSIVGSPKALKCLPDKASQ
jgi:hypothetical protein